MMPEFSNCPQLPSANAGHPTVQPVVGPRPSFHASHGHQVPASPAQNPAPAFRPTREIHSGGDGGGGNEGGDGNSVRQWVEPWLLRTTPELPTPLVPEGEPSFQRELGATESLRLATQITSP